MVRIAARPKAERAVQEVLLVDWLKQHRDGPLRYLVLEGRDAERTLAPIRFVDVATSDWRRAITTRFKPIDQVLQILLQMGRILLRRLTVDSHRTVLARALIGVPQPLGIEVLVQRRERHRRVRCRQLGYSLLFR